MNEIKARLIKSRRYLEMAHHDQEDGFFEGAVSHAYYAMFHAAKAFLELNDKSPRTHKGVILQLGQYVKLGKLSHELAWNVLRDYLREKGNQDIHGSRDATREAFKLGLIHDGDSWMDMIKDRNRTVHTYNKDTAREIAFNITDRFFALFVALQETMQGLRDEQ